jgi:ribosome-associated protein
MRSMGAGARRVWARCDPHAPSIAPTRGPPFPAFAGQDGSHIMIRLTDKISLDEREIDESFVRASGPGGQNVNKLSTAVQLRFDVRNSPSLPGDVRGRLERLAGSRLTRDGVLVIIAQSHRTQARNRDDAMDRLIALVRRAAIAPRPRRPTRPTRASRERRIESKKRRAGVKRLRGARPSFE